MTLTLNYCTDFLKEDNNEDAIKGTLVEQPHNYFKKYLFVRIRSSISNTGISDLCVMRLCTYANYRQPYLLHRSREIGKHSEKVGQIRPRNFLCCFSTALSAVGDIVCISYYYLLFLILSFLYLSVSFFISFLLFDLFSFFFLYLCNCISFSFFILNLPCHLKGKAVVLELQA